MSMHGSTGKIIEWLALLPVRRIMSHIEAVAPMKKAFS